MTRFSNVLTRLSFAAPIVPTPTLTLHPPPPRRCARAHQEGHHEQPPELGPGAVRADGGRGGRVVTDLGRMIVSEIGRNESDAPFQKYKIGFGFRSRHSCLRRVLAAETAY